MLLEPSGPLGEFRDAVAELLRKLKPRGLRRFVGWPLTKLEVERFLALIERLESLISLHRQEDHL